MMVYSTHVSSGARPLVPPEHVCMIARAGRDEKKHTQTKDSVLKGFSIQLQVTFTQTHSGKVSEDFLIY